MRMRSVFYLACALAACGNSASTKAPRTEQQRVETWYHEWAAKQARPSPQLVDHIEALLVRERCIGDLNRWSRSYAYSMLPERIVDTSIVQFHLEMLGGEGVKPGRQITAPFLPNLDDRRIKVADGDYDLKDKRVRVGFCGNTFGASRTDADKARRYWAELERRRAARGSKSR